MVPGEKETLPKIQQSTMESWRNKTQVMTMLTQTRETKTIRQNYCKAMTIPKQKLHAQWRRRNNAFKENIQQPGKEGWVMETEYAENAEKTDITQLVAIRSEMPEGWN